MADKNFSDVTLAYADPNLLLCWEEKVKQAAECTLLLKHSRGKIETILKVRSAKILHPKVLLSADLLSTPAEKKKKKKGNKNKRLEALLSYHQRLVEDKGLPPSRLMLQHAAVSGDPEKGLEHFNCHHCEYTTFSKHGLGVHVGVKHKGLQKPEVSHEEVSLPKEICRCTFCREQFDTKRDFEQHTSRFWVTYEDIKCPLCDSFHRNCYYVKEHMKEKHQRDLSFTAREYT